ncbi:hypothetical protein ACS0TY_010870 [Phlomoides rotata]
MVEMHEMVPGKRFDRYHELGQYAFGEKLGLYIVVPQQIVVEVSSCIVYMVTGGKSLHKFHQTVCPDCKDIKLTYFIIIFSSIHFVLSHLPNFNSISVISLSAAVMSLAYSTIAWTAALGKGTTGRHVDYSLRGGDNTSDNVFNFFNALGDIAFAYAGHNVVLEIQATLPSTPDKPSKLPMWRGVIFAYIIVAICYFPVAFFGYYIFGNTINHSSKVTTEDHAHEVRGAAGLFSWDFLFQLRSPLSLKAGEQVNLITISRVSSILIKFHYLQINLTINCKTFSKKVAFLFVFWLY